MKTCIRCGRSEQIERHHIKQRIHGGGDEEGNLEDRCQPCHKYEHTLRALEAKLEFEKQRGQADRIACYQHRIDVLNQLNRPELIVERGTYLSYWTDRTTRYLPRKIKTKAEIDFEDSLHKQLELWMQEVEQ